MNNFFNIVEKVREQAQNGTMAIAGFVEENASIGGIVSGAEQLGGKVLSGAEMLGSNIAQGGEALGSKLDPDSIKSSLSGGAQKLATMGTSFISQAGEFKTSLNESIEKGTLRKDIESQVERMMSDPFGVDQEIEKEEEQPAAADVTPDLEDSLDEKFDEKEM